MIAWVLAAVVATSEFCAEEPVSGGPDEPEFCHLKSAERIETPHFSVTVEAGFDVGVDRGGRRLVARPVHVQSPASFVVEVFDAPDSTRLGGCTRLTQFEQDGLAWRECLRESPEQFWRLLATRVGHGEAIVEYRYSPAGTPLAPALERMLQSTRIRISRP